MQHCLSCDMNTSKEARPQQESEVNWLSLFVARFDYSILN